jgi:signal peptidase II
MGLFSTMRNRYYLVALLILVADQLSKWLANLRLQDGSIELIPGFLRFSLVYNSGVAFGFFSGHEAAWKPYVLAGMAVAALVVLHLYARRMSPDRRLLHWALAITMGGILGNLVDRIFRGYVVDFIEFHINDAFYWPNFNVADSAITIGIALLLIDTVRNPMQEAAESTANGRQ